MSKTAYKQDAPGNWISIQKYEQTRDLQAGKITTKRGEVPKAWINTKTKRIIFQESPFSSLIRLGKLNESNYQITEKDRYNMEDKFASPQEVVDRIFEYMEQNNGMTSLGNILER